MNKVKYVHTIKYYFPIKENEEQSSDACHNLGQAWNILPVTKGHVLYDSFIWKSRLGKSIEAESRPVVTEGRGCEGCV